MPLTKEAVETSFYGHKGLTALLLKSRQDLQRPPKIDAELSRIDVDYDAPAPYNHESHSGTTCFKSDNGGDSDTISEPGRGKLELDDLRTSLPDRPASEEVVLSFQDAGKGNRPINKSHRNS